MNIFKTSNRWYKILTVKNSIKLKFIEIFKDSISFIKDNKHIWAKI